jgi:hypothetical protein
MICPNAIIGVICHNYSKKTSLILILWEVPAVFEKLTQLLDGFLEKDVPGYDCIVYHKGQEVFRRFGGYSSFESKTPTRGNEQYFLYAPSPSPPLPA